MARQVVSQEDLVTKWRRWCDTVRSYLVQANHDRALWEATTKAIEDAAPESPGVWTTHYARLYAAGQLMAVRRVVRGKGGSSISLTRLLGDIANNPSVLSKEYYLSLSVEDSRTSLEDLSTRYEEMWGDGNGRVDPRKARDDKEALSRALVVAFEHADRRIAYIDETVADTRLSFAELNLAVEQVGVVYRRWAALLASVHYELTPALRDDWQQTFAVPLFPS
jgi:hypothetical protein